MRGRTSWLTALVVAALAAVGCAEGMIPTPYMMRGEAGRAMFEKTAERLRTPEIPIVYVTDRAIVREGGRGVEYGSGRSKDVSFGVATISLGKGVEWDALKADSATGTRSRAYTPRVARVERSGAFASPSSMYEVADGRLQLRPGAVEEFRSQLESLRGVIDTALEGAERREVVVFVHGFNNTFDDAILRLGQAWHCAGRPGAPIVFTWPAGFGGLFGYAYDRESGEYAVMHLKLLLATLAADPGVEKIHIIAHSRGTDVATTALRELHTEIRGYRRGRPLVGDFAPGESLGRGLAPSPTYTDLKLETLVLAAPDLDLDVFVQRFFGDNVLQAARRTIIYFSADDGALGLSNWLFSGRRRLGALRVDDIPEAMRPTFAKLDAVELINAKVTGYTSHSYILQHPAALSDLLLALYEGKKPGAANGRPLKAVAPGIWELDNDYLRGAGAREGALRGGPRAGTP